MKYLANNGGFQRILGHLACLAAYSIFGFNIIICKDLTSSHILSPTAIFLLRCIGAGGLFWLISLFLPKEKVERRDLPKIALASFFGYFATQLSFLFAIPLITPMDCSIMSAMSPIYTMIIAAIAIKEPISLKKAGGVALSFCGIIYLIVTASHSSNGVAQTSPSGIVMMIVNALSFSLYLGIFKPVIAKYSVVTFMKWIFLFAGIMVLPISAKEVVSFDYSTMPLNFVLELAYLIVCATFMAYFLIPVGQKRIKPTLVSMYSYVQPIIAIAISICIGMDKLSFTKVVAAITVFAGVILVSYSKGRSN